MSDHHFGLVGVQDLYIMVYCSCGWMGEKSPGILRFHYTEIKAVRSAYRAHLKELE